MKPVQAIKNFLRKYTRYFYILYADSTVLLDKAQKVLRPLPEGCKLVKMTMENKNRYKCEIGDVDKMLQFSGGGYVWVIVNDDNEIIGFQYGMYRGAKSLFFKVRNCDYEHIEIKVDERYRRKGIAVYLLYHAVNNLEFNDVRNKKVGTCIKPTNTASLKLHQLIGFKISHKVLFVHKRRKLTDGCYSIRNIPRFRI